MKHIIITRIIPQLLMAAIIGFCSSCDKENLVPEQENDADAGACEFVVNIGGGNTADGADTPFEVSGTDPVSVTIVQKSSYTDPDGSVFTCEPKANINIRAMVDTVFASDIQDLTRILSKQTNLSDSKKDNLAEKDVKQKFVIGGQEINIDLGYEIYTYVNSKSKAIEMPYVKVDSAKLATSGTNETRGGASAIVLRSMALTRASVVDTATFEVNVKFEVELETVNTKSDSKQTVEFNVSYVGVVENMTELYGENQYDIVNSDGTKVRSPFTLMESGEIVLSFEQNSVLKTDNKVVYSSSPKASINFKVENDTAWVENLDELSNAILASVPETVVTGDNPISNALKCTYKSGSQTFEFDTNYEVHVTDNSIEMPYLIFSKPTLVGIETQAINTASGANASDTTLYNVTAKFKIECENMNVLNADTRELYFEANYIGAVVRKLVNTTYRKDFVYYEPYCDIGARFVAFVYRDRYYSDGSVKTDEFFGLPHPAIMSAFCTDPGEENLDGSVVQYDDNLVVRYGNSQISYPYDISCVREISTEVPSMDLLRIDDLSSKFDEAGADEYVGTSNNGPFDGEIEGWYVLDFHTEILKDLMYGDTHIRRYILHVSYVDRFLYIDGKIIDFSEYRPQLSYKFTESEYKGNSTRGPGKVFKHEMSGTYNGHEVLYVLADTVYTPKK